MNGESFLEIFGEIDSALIEEARPDRSENHATVLFQSKKVAYAASFVILFALVSLASVFLARTIVHSPPPPVTSAFIIENGRLLSYTGEETKVYVPSHVNEIANGAFSQNKTITAVIIPAGVTKIESSAFTACANLAEISISEENPSYVSVNGVVFSEYGRTLYIYPSGKADSSYTIPAYVDTVAAGAFTWNNYLTSVTLSEGVKTVRQDAFSYCDALASVYIPASVMVIEPRAFNDCRSLEKITVSVQNTAYTDKDGVLFADDGRLLHTYPPARTGEYTVPANTAVLADFCFAQSKLTRINLPPTLKVIQSSVFAFSTVHTLAFEENTELTAISREAFYACAIRELLYPQPLEKYGIYPELYKKEK